jgi:hypothetical protein
MEQLFDDEPQEPLHTPIPSLPPIKVLSCVPEQKLGQQAKLEWLEKQLIEHAPDLLLTPQEFFGGVQQLFFKVDEPLAYEEDVVLDPIKALAVKHHCIMAFGALVIDRVSRLTRERFYLVGKGGDVAGYYDKMMLPAYDVAGLTDVSPEESFRNRSQVVDVDGIRVSVLFCWEVYSSYLWHAISRANPDLLLHPIKFGVSGWPQKGKDPATGKDIVTGFGFGADGGWVERLKMGSRYDIAAPVVCSTNSWNLPNRSKPLAGVIYPFENVPDTLWHPAKGERGNITEHVQVDIINPLEWRFIRENKYQFFEATGTWPASLYRKKTMMWKIKRMERTFAGLRTSRKKKTGQFKEADGAPLLFW